MDLTDHLVWLRESLAALEKYAERAGLDAEVPTTPGWTVRQLVAHTGEVLRWSTGQLQGVPHQDRDSVQAQGLASADPVEWLQQGGLDLIQAVRDAPAALDVPVLFEGSPTPLRFWARRMCHEVTIHAVDALAASLGRSPRAVETWIGRSLALDGLDELLVGVVGAGVAPQPDRPLTVAVRPEGATSPSWLLRLGEGAQVWSGDVRPDGPVDVLLDAGAVSLYLAVWSRTEELSSGPDAAFWAAWRDGVRLQRGA